MKKTLMIMGLLFATITQLCAQEKAGWIHLTGQLKGFTNQVELEDMSEFQYLVPPNADRVIVPDAKGRFSIKFKAAAPNYYRLGYHLLYLSPGTKLNINIDGPYADNTSYSGKDAAACTYLLNTPGPKGGSFLEAGGQLQATPKATIDTIEHMASLRYKELELLKGVSPEFKRLEKARIKADIINSIQMGEVYGIFKVDNRGKPQYLKGIDSANYLKNYRLVSLPKIKAYSKNFTNASLMKLVVYRDIADMVIKQGGKQEELRKIKDWYVCDSLVRAMRGISDKNRLKLFNNSIADIKTIDYKNAVKQSLSSLMAFGKGDLAVDFTATDQNGSPVNLSSLKGKVIYVDIWATWCGPCVEELPFLEKLKEHYSDNPNVVFVSLSIDSDAGLWKKSLDKRKAGGHQWLIDRIKLNKYNIVGIPRALLIDKDFNIVEMSAPLPSQAAAVKAINGLL